MFCCFYVRGHTEAQSAVVLVKTRGDYCVQNDYCDTISIAGGTIAILLLLWTTIAILL